MQPRSRESIEISRDTLTKEFQKIQDELKLLKEKQEYNETLSELIKVVKESNEKVMHVSNINAKEGTFSYFGWGLEPGYRYKLFYDSDTYKVLEDYNYRNNVIRYAIEPIEHLQNPNGYFHSLKHVITENPAFREMLSQMRPTINLETLDDKGESRFSFFFFHVKKKT
jgi:hypothetical protein